MARRKQANVARTASSRSLAAIFNETSPELLAPASDEKPTTIEPSAPVEDEESTEPVKFPLSLIYDFQDLLNNHLTVSKGVQVMVCLYLCQIFYIHLHKETGMEVISAVGFNILSAIVAMRRLKRPLTPNCLPFNSLYAFFIPYSFVLLLADPKDPFFQVNLSLTNFSLQNLHPIAKVLSAFVYNYMFSDANTLDIVQFGQVVWIYFMVEFALKAWNEETVEEQDGSYSVRRTMDPTEIHIVAIFMVNLLANFNVPLSDTTVPIYIVRILSLALIGAFALATPIYYAYLQLQSGVLRAFVALLVVSVFSTTFYYLTNYLFQLFVVKKEVLTWLFEFIAATELRQKLLTYWVLALGGILPAIFFAASKDIISINNRRKVWHFALVGALAYPALTQEPTFSAIAVLGSVFIFIALECLRCTRITFMGDVINSLLHFFQDDKDLKGPLSLLYIFLLVGVAIPIGYGVVVDDVVSMRSYLGLIALGLGDSLASIIGKRFGKTKWKGESRSVEGTVAYIVVTFASFVLADFYVLPEGARVKNWENMFIVSLVGGAIEGSASLNDNVLIPSVTLITYELLNKVF
ncbi:hypothetical protein HF325_003955 [Metschnikowia pulcherrima]|uniref:dolichol kinase n=1 Tax=Metschnikowia pulcherrima TaxID=27326 RepID=A0A8H7LAQ5_9ASCO|nr:hypothetical protein HF325_003955 [Metschnikowia pulcherrima]